MRILLLIVHVAGSVWLFMYGMKKLSNAIVPRLPGGGRKTVIAGQILSRVMALYAGFLVGNLRHPVDWRVAALGLGLAAATVIVARLKYPVEPVNYRRLSA